MLETGMILNDRYEILRVIGKGGMSTVYQARSLQDGTLLAVKDVTRSATGENQVVEESLSAEGRMLKQLSNPHLPRIYDIIENETNIMLIMDFVDGESLDKVIARTGPQPMDTVLDWGMQICNVFSYLHSQPTPIIYRDMKPANVMVERSGKLMMIDFGTARTEKVGVEMQEDTVCIGTVGFAAPEQYGGYGQSTAQTDIFCLGATLYNMITGHSPCDPPAGILPLERWNPALAKSPLAKIIYKCTRNDPAERYRSADQLYYDLSLAKKGVSQNNNQYLYNAKAGGDSWQKQEIKRAGISGGLSGLLKRNPAEKKSETRSTGFQRQPQPAQQPAPQPMPPQAIQQQPVRPAAPVAVQEPAYQPPQNTWQESAPYYGNVAEPAPNVRGDTSRADRGKKLALISAIMAALFVLLSVLSLVLEQTTLGLVFLIVAAGAVVLALTGIILSKTDSGN